MILDLAALNSEKLFKREMTAQELLPTYRSLLQRRAGYPTSFRCKMNISGRNTIRFWTPQKEPREAPQDLTECNILPHIVIKSLWIGPQGWGVTSECTDAQVYEHAQPACPF